MYLNLYNRFTSENVLEKPKGMQDMSLREKLKFLTSHITVEPMLLCYIVPSILAALATQNLNLDKACRVNMNYGDVICDSLIDRNIGNYTV